MLDNSIILSSEMFLDKNTCNLQISNYVSGNARVYVFLKMYFVLIFYKLKLNSTKFVSLTFNF